MFVELHMIQSFAPSNLNRDDTNNPKDCEFGGVRRARISSQCLKRAMRTCPVFAETTQVPLAMRTRWITRLLAERLTQAGKPEEEAQSILADFLPAYMSKLDKKGEHTAVLLYLSEREIDAMVSSLLENWDDLTAEGDEIRKKTISTLQRALTKGHRGYSSAPDIALFGRMLAEAPDLNLEASCQVAHAISTHRVSMEMDFYTAVDDLQPDSEPGAGMMGFTGFDSACFYRYARLDWAQLVRNLKGDTALALRTVEAFLRVALAAVPSAKQNSFAANNPPSLALAVVREDGMGWSLVNAFERPVRPEREGGLIVPSVTALDAYWGDLCQMYGEKSIARTAVLARNDLPLTHLQEARVDGQEAWLRAVLEVGVS